MTMPARTLSISWRDLRPDQGASALLQSRHTTLTVFEALQPKCLHTTSSKEPRRCTDLSENDLGLQACMSGTRGSLSVYCETGMCSPGTSIWHGVFGVSVGVSEQNMLRYFKSEGLAQRAMQRRSGPV